MRDGRIFLKFSAPLFGEGRKEILSREKKGNNKTGEKESNMCWRERPE
jgi:hypothetical protein